MQHSAELHRCLVDCDVVAIRKLWQHVAPHLPQSEDNADTLVSIHIARTQLGTIPFKLRAYSHRWLIDQGFPSGLPDELRPKAERIYPCIAEGVGISVNARSALFRPIAKLVCASAVEAVMECYADKRTEPEFVKARMHEARTATIRKLLGQ